MGLIVIEKNKEKALKSEYNQIIGLENYSVNYKNQISYKNLDQLKYNNKVFIAINKMIFNDEIKELEKILTKISKSKVYAVLFYDLSILSIVKRLNLNIRLVWNQTHMVTNYRTANYYYKQGVYGCVLSNEITLSEMIEMKYNTNLKVMANIIFKPVMAHSKRSLLTNYFKNINSEKENKDYDIYEEKTNTKFIVNEDKNGTNIIYGNVINGIPALYDMIENNFDYVIVDTTYLEDEIADKSLDLVNKILSRSISKEDAIKLSSQLLGEDTGFFYKRTIYKVK